MEQVHRYVVSRSYNATTSGQKLIYGFVLVGWDITMNPFYISHSPKQVVEIVDPVLVQEKEEGETSAYQCFTKASTKIHIKIEESLISILEIGLACSAELPRERLDVTDVVAEMCRIRNKLRSDKMSD